MIFVSKISTESLIFTMNFHVKNLLNKNESFVKRRFNKRVNEFHVNRSFFKQFFLLFSIRSLIFQERQRFAAPNAKRNVPVKCYELRINTFTSNAFNAQHVKSRWQRAVFSPKMDHFIAP